jgi:hypothetical protein
MSRTLLGIGAAGVLLAAAAAAQDRTATPGEPTQAHVFIQNTGEAEAIPVTLQQVGRVQLVEPVTLAPSTAVDARAIRQAWEYRTVTIAAGQDAAMLLNAAGADGWEAAGILNAQTPTVVVMKRPR